MIVSVELPDSVAHQMHLDGADGKRRALEMLALEGYRSGELSRGQVSELLGLELNETMRFLKDHGCAQSVTIEEFERDAKALRGILGR